MSEQRNLYIGGLEEEVTEAVLKAAFLPFGDIVDVSIPVDAGSQKTRGFGFVQFESVEDAAAAVDNMNDSEVYGRRIRVNYARPLPKAGHGKAVWDATDDWLRDQQKEDDKDFLESEKSERRADDGMQPALTADTG
mmetsp:Transcript_7663/g.34044  ORF Transcript_7663/g.34044 Transcript_7663/m.34044 type:complete len:136 (-) Transcript_7663:2559-2966(-)